MKKTLSLSALALSATLFSFSSFAKYIEYIPANGWSAEGKVTYKNGSTQFSKTHKSSTLRKITSKAHQIESYETQLRSQIRSEIQKQINGKASLKRYSFNVNGDLEIRLRGLSNGNIEARVGNISVASSAKIKKSWYARGRININSNKLYLTGTYNPITGKLNNLTANSNFKVNVDVDVDSALDWLIPGFNWLVTNKLEDKIESSVKSSIYSALNSRTNGYEDVLFGLDRYLPHGKYVYRGKDYAVELENAFKDLVSGESITVKAYTRSKSLRNNGSVNIGHVDINISNHLFLKVNDTITTRTRWEPECGDFGCTAEP